MAEDDAISVTNRFIDFHCVFNPTTQREYPSILALYIFNDLYENKLNPTRANNSFMIHGNCNLASEDILPVLRMTN
jgi:hypothetical protein